MRRSTAARATGRSRPRKPSAAPYGLIPQPLPEFDDLDYGTWHGLTHDEARQRWPEQWALWTSAPEEVTFPQGENLADLSARVVAGLAQSRGRRPAAAAIVVVGHDSINRILLMQLLGMHLRFYRMLAQDPCCINVIELPGANALSSAAEFDRAPARRSRRPQHRLGEAGYVRL